MKSQQTMTKLANPNLLLTLIHRTLYKLNSRNPYRGGGWPINPPGSGASYKPRLLFASTYAASVIASAVENDASRGILREARSPGPSHLSDFAKKGPKFLLVTLVVTVRRRSPYMVGTCKSLDAGERRRRHGR